MAKPTPNFALLIGKKGGDSSGPPTAPTTDEHDQDLSEDDNMNKEDAENSAVAQLVSAIKGGDHEAAKDALKDFLETCYPQLGDSDKGSENDEPESAEEDSTENY